MVVGLEYFGEEVEFGLFGSLIIASVAFEGRWFSKIASFIMRRTRALSSLVENLLWGV